MYIIRGTTSTLKFKLPVTKGELAWATIRVWQPHNPSTLLPITKELSNCAGADDSSDLLVSLTAEETYRFSSKYKGKVQIRYEQVSNGSVAGMREEYFTVYPMFGDDSIIIPDVQEELVVFNGQSIID